MSPRSLSVVVALVALVALGVALADAASLLRCDVAPPMSACVPDELRVGRSNAYLGGYFSCLLDRDGSGRVSARELGAFFQPVVGDHAWWSTSRDEHLNALIAVMDTDQSGDWTWDEFCTAVQHDHSSLQASNDSNNDEPEDAEIPQQVHLTLTDASTITVLWITRASNLTTPVAQFSVAGAATNATLSAIRYTYAAGTPPWQGTIYRVTFPTVAANVRYSYRVGDAETGKWSPIRSFSLRDPTRFDPAPMQWNEHTRRWESPTMAVYGVFGDMGTVIPAGYRVARQMTADDLVAPFDFLFHVGDVSYASTQYFIGDTRSSNRLRANGNNNPLTISASSPMVGWELEFIWDAFGRQMEPIADHIPYLIGVGNHERFYNYSAYLARYDHPAPWNTPDPQGNTQFWFSVDHGFTHWVFMSTEHPYEPGSVQHDWLVADLEAASKTARWIILTGHRPMYSSDDDEQDQHWPGAHLQTMIEPLMAQYKVDMYMGGHMHMYERVHAVLNGTVMTMPVNVPVDPSMGFAMGTDAHTLVNVYKNPGGAVQVVQGTAGIFQDHKFIDPQPAWTADRGGAFGYGRVTVYDEHWLHYEFMGIDDAGMLDECWIFKN